MQYSEILTQKLLHSPTLTWQLGRCELGGFHDRHAMLFFLHGGSVSVQLPVEIWSQLAAHERENEETNRKSPESILSAWKQSQQCT